MSALRRVSLESISESVDYGVTASAVGSEVGPKFLRITDIQDGRVDWSSVPWCECSQKEIDGSRLQPGDIVFARTGATTGKSFLIRDCPKNTVFASYLIRVRLSGDVDSGYVGHFFNSSDYWAQISKGARGVAQPGVNATTLKALEIPLPSLPEQRRIAAILDKADALRAKRREALSQLDRLAQSIFVEMFGDPISNRMSWDVKPLTEACYCYSGGTPSKDVQEFWDGEIPWFSAKDMKKTDLFDAQDHVSEKAFEKTSIKLLPKDTVAIVVRGMILAHTFPVGVLRVTAAINQDLKALIPNVQLNCQFLANCLRVQASSILGKVSESAHGTKRLDSDGLASIPVILPPKDSQDAFASRIEKIEALSGRLLKSLSETEIIFSSLQHRAFQGTL